MKQLRKIILTITLCVFIGIFALTAIANRWSFCGLLILSLLIIGIQKAIQKKQTHNKAIGKLQIIWLKIQPYFPILLFTVAFFFRFTVLHILKIEPYSDYYTLFTAADCLANGENIMVDSPYFQMWGFQTGFVLYQAVILKIFQTEMMLHILDCIYTSFICVLIYQMGRDLWKSNHKLPSVLYTGYLFGIAFTGVLSNQHLYNVLVLIGIWIWLHNDIKEKPSWKIYFLVAILLSFAQIIRTETILILTAFFVYEFLKIRKKEEILTFAKKIILLLGTYVIISQGANYLVKVTELNPAGLANQNMLWKFVCGADYESGGRYSERGEQFIDDQEAEKQFILESYTSLTPMQWIDFLGKKINNFWTQDSYQWFYEEMEEEDVEIPEEEIQEIVEQTVLDEIEEVENVEEWIEEEKETALPAFIVEIVKIIDGMGYLFVFFFALIAMEKARKEERTTKDFFIYLLLLHFLVYLVIEVQPRYAYLARILLFILAMDGLNQWKEIVEIWKQKKERKLE